MINQFLKDKGMQEYIDYKRNTPIGRYNVDFLIWDRYIIECFGDYWHKNPNNHSGIIAKNQWDRDMKKQLFLESLGYSYIQLWENDIHKNWNKILEFLNGFFNSFYAVFEWESCIW